MKNYIKNLETGKIELHFDKSEYIALDEGQKKELKRYYLWSRRANAWVSRGIHNQYGAIQVAKKLGFTEEERKGQRLSFAEEVQRKAEKAELRAERFEGYADNAVKRAEGLQAEFNRFRGDIAFITQPIIRGHAGSESFGRRRERILDRYTKGFEEYRKSEYFQDRAKTARNTADMKQYENKVYVNNRIEECHKNIRALERRVAKIEERNCKNELQGLPKIDLTDVLDKMEYEIDKLSFLTNCLDAIGGIQYSKENIKPGYLIKVRRRWAKVIKVNTKTVAAIYIEHPLKGFDCRTVYAEIQEIKIPEGWTEESQEIKNPFVVGDVLVRNYISSTKIMAAFQVVKVSAKTIQIQKIKVEDNRPMIDSFVDDKQERRSVKKDRQGNFVVNDGDWYLYRYSPIEEVEQAM